MEGGEAALYRVYHCLSLIWGVEKEPPCCEKGRPCRIEVEVPAQVVGDALHVWGQGVDVHATKVGYEAAVDL